MLWDVIRDFFVHLIFGGIDSHSNYYAGKIGYFFKDGSGGMIDTSDRVFVMNGYDLSFGDWLSTTATIISLVIIVYLCCMLIKQIYNICAHVIG